MTSACVCYVVRSARSRETDEQHIIYTSYTRYYICITREDIRLPGETRERVSYCNTILQASKEGRQQTTDEVEKNPTKTTVSYRIISYDDTTPI